MMLVNGDYSYITDWWFGTFLMTFHSVGNFIIPTDEHIFQRGWNRQPDENGGSRCISHVFHRETWWGVIEYIFCEHEALLVLNPLNLIKHGGSSQLLVTGGSARLKADDFRQVKKGNPKQRCLCKWWGNSRWMTLEASTWLPVSV